MASPLLEDPRARDLLDASPDDVEQVAAAFRRAASDAGTIGPELTAAAGDAVWQGPAAAAFRRSIGHLPGEMARILDGYGAVAAALGDYAVQLGELSSAFRALVPEVAAAEQATAPAGVTAADRAALRARAARLLEAFEIAREACRQQVAAAQATAPVVHLAPARPGTGSGSGTTVIGMVGGRPE